MKLLCKIFGHKRLGVKWMTTLSGREHCARCGEGIG